MQCSVGPAVAAILHRCKGGQTEALTVSQKNEVTLSPVSWLMLSTAAEYVPDLQSAGRGRATGGQAATPQSATHILPCS